MDRLTSSEKKVSILLLATLTCIATMLIKLPTPGGGYVNLGDGFVLASGILFGPVYGALAAGTGSSLADLINGYSHMAPATFIIKAITATIAAICYRLITRHHISERYSYINVSIAAAAGEAFMIIGYAVYRIFMLIYESGRLNRTVIQSAALSSAKELPYDLLQAAAGIMITIVMTPLLARLITRSK
ncbi:MAG: ECF transporter S component [Lachnospiraceae bacterium]|nr:ECF transporter S component [Lachnospiraceae bacterium]